MGAPLHTDNTLTVTGPLPFPSLPSGPKLTLVLGADNRTGKTITVPITHNSIPATAFKKLNKAKPDEKEGEREEDDVTGALAVLPASSSTPFTLPIALIPSSSSTLTFFSSSQPV